MLKAPVLVYDTDVLLGILCEFSRDSTDEFLREEDIIDHVYRMARQKKRSKHTSYILSNYELSFAHKLREKPDSPEYKLRIVSGLQKLVKARLLEMKEEETRLAYELRKGISHAKLTGNEKLYQRMYKITSLGKQTFETFDKKMEETRGRIEAEERIPAMF